MKIDAFGKPCPMPLMMAKKELDAGCRELEITVDNKTAVDNLTHLAEVSKLSLAIEDIEGGYLVRFSEGTTKSVEQKNTPYFTERHDTSFTTEQTDALGDYALFIGKDHVGEGDEELGYNLMKMALYTFAESKDAPASLLFMNAGVKLLAEDEPQIIESVTVLLERGTEVLVCGTCLDFYGIKDRLRVGTVSNMYDIVERMQAVTKVISL